MKMFARLAAAVVMSVSVSAQAIDDQGLCKSDSESAFKVLKDMGIMALDAKTMSELINQITALEGAQLSEAAKNAETQMKANPKMRAIFASQPKMIAAALAAVEEVGKGSLKIKDSGVKSIVDAGMFQLLTSGLTTYSRMVDLFLVSSDAKATAQAKENALQTARIQLLSHKVVAAKVMKAVEALKKPIFKNDGNAKANAQSQKIIENLIKNIEIKSCQNAYRAI